LGFTVVVFATLYDIGLKGVQIVLDFGLVLILVHFKDATKKQVLQNSPLILILVI